MVNKKWGTISVEIVANAFEREKIENFEYLDEVMDFLEDDLKDQPEIYESLGLILSPRSPTFFSRDRSYGEDMVEVDDESLNPGKPPLRVHPTTMRS